MRNIFAPVAVRSVTPLAVPHVWATEAVKLPTATRPQGTSVFAERAVIVMAGGLAGADAARPATDVSPVFRGRTTKQYHSGPPRDQHLT